MSHIFFEITVVLVLATAFGAAARLLRQPTVIGYIAAGLIVGPLGFMRLNNVEVVDAMAQFGIALLLFLVGMEINLGDLRQVGRNVVLIGLGQIVFTAAVGFLISLGLGLPFLAALYVAVPLTFSSTIIVVKLLSEDRALDSLHGRISLGILLVQDFIALGVLIVLSGLRGTEVASLADIPWATLGAAFIKGTVFLFAALALGKWVVPPVFHLLGRSQEILFLASLAWGLGLAALVAMPQIGLTIEIGSFLAGLALAKTVEHHQISSRIRPLRDFFLVMFFIVLGSKVAISHVGSLVTPILVLSAFVLVGNPLIVMLLMRLLGYRARISFMAGITMAMVSEFSLVVVLLGRQLGHIDDATVAIVTAVSIVSIVVSSYLIKHSEKLYRFLKGPLRVFEIGLGGEEPVQAAPGLRNHVVLVGCHRMGQSILHALEHLRAEFMVVDFNPDVIARLEKADVKAVYGDASDPEIQDLAGLSSARAIISTVPDPKDSLALLAAARRLNPRAKVILTAENEYDALDLYEAKADYVLLPHFIGGLQMAHLIDEDRQLLTLPTLRARDIRMITETP
jgi:Kef-type K+ transport system membrane component KefB/voltage-gated potassium channel Kch